MAIGSPPAPSAMIDIAGSAWPVYKLEALVAALMSGLILALITGSAQIAVLVAAAVGATRWAIGLVAASRLARANDRTLGPI